MWNFSFFSFFLFFLVAPQNISTNTLPVHLINTTCKTCAKTSIIFNYDFCLTSLQAVPVSHVTNLPGLAIVAMELAFGNATATVSAIEKMKTGSWFDPFARECLTDCLEMYADAMSMIVDSIRDFLMEQYGNANTLMSAVMEAATTCEEGFEDKEGEVTPLTKENYNLFELSDIALCIINLLTFTKIGL
ncbi:hypothetical protein LguiA_015274 [Lonicera macranthoides]